ncbi:MAG: ankyrin repeat domain-containing protein [Burkholderiaceae bacterium]|nr:ankyrin repeat domain-containing protein [Burkholderiaceae bacterium]
MRSYLRIVLVALVLQGFPAAHAGSYEDFFAAIRRDRPDVIQGLLQRGFDPNTPDPENQKGLLIAVGIPSAEAAKALIAWPKTDLNVLNSADESALMLASLRGYDDLVVALIERGAYVNKPGWAALHYAATNGHLSIMKRLLEAHAFIDAESPNGTTPLMMAAHYGSTDAVKLLLDEGADPLMKNQQNLTAIDFARRANRADAAELIAKAIRARQPRSKSGW